MYFTDLHHTYNIRESIIFLLLCSSILSNLSQQIIKTICSGQLWKYNHTSFGLISETNWLSMCSWESHEQTPPHTCTSINVCFIIWANYSWLVYLYLAITGFLSLFLCVSFSALFVWVGAGTAWGNSNSLPCFSNPILNYSDMKGWCLEYGKAVVVVEEGNVMVEKIALELRPRGYEMIPTNVHLCYNMPAFPPKNWAYPYTLTIEIRKSFLRR